MTTTFQPRIVDGTTEVIARVLPTDRPCPFGFQADRLSTKVHERYGNDPLSLRELWGALEAARSSETGWSILDRFNDGCSYDLVPNELSGFTLLAGGDLAEHFTERWDD